MVSARATAVSEQRADLGASRRHQDQCFFHPCSDAAPTPTDWSERAPVISAWVPLMDATMDTGGMQVLGPAQDKLHHHYSANVTEPGVTIHPDQ